MPYTASPPVGTPQRHGTGWRVRSGSPSGGFYFVHITRDTVRCTCPAWVYRRTQLAGECKHIQAVRKLFICDEGARS